EWLHIIENKNEFFREIIAELDTTWNISVNERKIKMKNNS
ncbi:10474_t:CDS:1, partial [Gigaspora rosea]